MNGETMYHIGLNREQGAAFCLLTGDPGRVESVARLLERPRFVTQNREYVTWEGYIGEERVLAVSHGIGGPSTAICAEELILCGAKTLIRIGTCGGMALAVQGGDLVAASSAIRMDGTSREYMPLEFPAAADFAVTAALAEAARQLKLPCHIGVVQCKDSFYGQHSPESMATAPELTAKWQAWIQGGCLASEMESAALFIVAAVRGVRAGCILQTIWNQERVKAGLPDRRCRQPEQAAAVAVQALSLLIASQNQEESTEDHSRLPQ
ncbi:MAG: nucleoside phosphorylase [Clostridiales bacterium]|nr:nucleoside phosphorylase [Clostridiales bacterium]